ncbi:MAG: sulfite exporter TauE/SafE family protein, partial [bacterium]
LLGSLIGVQLGAIGTTYVKDYMIKLVMGTIMLIVGFSRGFAIVGYLKELELLTVERETVQLLNTISFFLMSAALTIGAVIILGSMYKGMRAPAVSATE